jgi:hypothetical protein
MLAIFMKRTHQKEFQLSVRNIKKDKDKSSFQRIVINLKDFVVGLGQGFKTRLFI